MKSSLLYGREVPQPVAFSAAPQDVAQDSVLALAASSMLKVQLFGPRSTKASEAPNAPTAMLLEYRDIYVEAREACNIARAQGKFDLNAMRIRIESMRAMWSVLKDCQDQAQKDRHAKAQVMVAVTTWMQSQQRNAPPPSLVKVPTARHLTGEMAEIARQVESSDI